MQLWLSLESCGPWNRNKHIFYIKGFRIAFPEETVSDAREYQSQCEAATLKTYFSFIFSASVFEIVIKVETLEVTDTTTNAVTV